MSCNQNTVCFPLFEFAIHQKGLTIHKQGLTILSPERFAIQHNEGLAIHTFQKAQEKVTYLVRNKHNIDTEYDIIRYYEKTKKHYKQACDLSVRSLARRLPEPHRRSSTLCLPREEKSQIPSP